MDKKIKKKAEKIIREFFKKTSFEVEFELKEASEENTLSLFLKTEEPQILIGERGRTLSESQMILGRILRKQLDEPFYLDLDINQYKENKTRYLRELANETADKVSLEKAPKELSPMSSYERRIIHLVLGERKDVKTESQGEEPRRRVVVRPA